MGGSIVTEEELEAIIEKAMIDRALKLDLRQNQLRRLPASIGDLTTLIELDLKANELVSLPQSIGNLVNLNRIALHCNQLTTLPESIGNLCDLTYLNLEENQLTSLPESIGNLSSLTSLSLDNNQISSLPESIGNLLDLTRLSLLNNNLTSLPASIGRLSKLTCIELDGNNYLEDLSILYLLPKLKYAVFRGVYLDRRYLTKLSNWKSEWLLDEKNVEMRRLLIQHVGYEKVCQELDAVEIDNWREYTLLKIDDIEVFYDLETENWGIPEEISREPMVLLKMTCPSTGHIHILRVPPEMTSAEAAITWVNHGIHPDEFTVQT
jgi:leucine-rich repeat protein SHOC2